jgi:serine/threonine protein kinase
MTLTEAAPETSADRQPGCPEPNPRPVRDPGQPEPPAYPPGHLIAPGYRLIEHLRRGEEMDSYEAWSLDRYCRCFVKTPRPDRLDDRTATGYLRREARLLLSLCHPHLVRGYEYVSPTPSQPPVLVCENLTGATLSYILDAEGGRLGLADLSYLGQHVCSALRYLHGRGYLHLDVNPGNIIASYGVTRLIDLSLARRPGRARSGLGTPGYLSPEQATGGRLGPPADVWGVGLVLYAAATGTQPFEIPDPPGTRTGASDPSRTSTRTLEQCRARLAVRPPRVRARRRLPPPVAQVIDACLRPQPEARPNLAELSAALASLTEPT